MIARSAEGVPLPAPNGEITFTVWGEWGGASEDVGFLQGRWSLDLTHRADWKRLVIADVLVEGLHAAVDSPAEFLKPPRGELQISVTLPRPTLLRVVDAGSGLDLSGIEVVVPRAFPWDGVLHPGTDHGARTLIRSARSPVEISQSLFGDATWGRVHNGVGEVRIGAPGHAWARVSLDLLRGGERALALERAGTLDVTLRGGSADLRAELRVRGAEGDRFLAAESVQGEGNVHIAGLPPGRLRASVEIGPIWSEPLVLGAAEVELFAGATSTATIALDAMPALDRAPASGRILLPTAWEQARPSVHLVLLDTALDGGHGFVELELRPAPSPRAGHAAFQWSHAGLQLGRYELRVHRPLGSMVFEVAPGGVRDVLFVLPPPAQLLVRLVQAGTANDVRTDGLHWRPIWPDGVTHGAMDALEFDERLGLHRGRAPAARILLGLSDFEYVSFQRELDLTLDPGELTIEVTRASGLRVALRDGDVPIAFPEDWWGEPVADGEPAADVGVSAPSAFLREYQVSAPGSYVLELPRIDGYLAVPPLRVDVRAGEFTRLDVQLQRGTGD